jgi:uncharacterized protein
MIKTNHLSSATLLTLVASFFITSCASVGVQPRVNSLATAQKLDQAIETLGDNPNIYGKNNRLLYWLDRGMVYHFAGRYKESIAAFAQAQRTFDELYTRSISKMATAWALNDYAAPYRGEDYEYVLVNIFQALNYTLLGDPNEALVEARDVDLKLNIINGLYAGKNMYKEDAFARFLMGILYEVNGSSSDLNDAFISYAKAYDVYANDFSKNYGIEMPQILKENLLTLAKFMGSGEFARYRDQLPDTAVITLEEKKKKAEVYLLQYVGFSPVKISYALPVPIDPSHLTQVSFPKFIPRFTEIKTSDFIAAKSDQLAFTHPTEVGHNIEAVAPKVLENRRLAIFAKSVLRPAVKYAAERVLEDKIEDQYGRGAAVGFNILSSIYNVSTERADLRSWQTLPAQIRIGRLLLEPGEYEFFVQTYAEGPQSLNKVSLGKFDLSAGEKKFLLLRNFR